MTTLNVEDLDEVMIRQNVLRFITETKRKWSVMQQKDGYTPIMEEYGNIIEENNLNEFERNLRDRMRGVTIELGGTKGRLYLALRHANSLPRYDLRSDLDHFFKVIHTLFSLHSLGFDTRCRIRLNQSNNQVSNEIYDVVEYLLWASDFDIRLKKGLSLSKDDEQKIDDFTRLANELQSRLGRELVGTDFLIISKLLWITYKMRLDDIDINADSIEYFYEKKSDAPYQRLDHSTHVQAILYHLSGSPDKRASSVVQRLKRND